MDAKTTVSPRVRLAAAGVLSLVLLVWVAIFDDSWQDVVVYIPACHRGGRNPSGILLTATLSLLTLTMLSPVLLRGRKTDRGLAGLLAAFPFFMFVMAAMWVL